MLVRCVVACATVLGAACPALADTNIEVGGPLDDELPPSLRIFRPDGAAIDQARLVLRVERDHVVGMLTLVLTTRARRWNEATIELALPRGAHVTGMAMATGSGADTLRGAAHALSTGEAHERYRETVQHLLDPALLEEVGRTRTHEQLALHVFPLAQGTPATIAIVLDLPRLAALELEPVNHTIAHVDIELGGAREQRTSFDRMSEARTLELPAPGTTVTTPLPAAVGEHVALLAEPALPPAPVVHFDLPITEARASDSLSAKEIRTYVHLHHPQLRRCYTLEAQTHPALAGTVELHMVVRTDGHLVVALGGTLDSTPVRDCIAREVASWQFRATETAVQVNYPLEFRLHD